MIDTVLCDKYIHLLASMYNCFFFSPSPSLLPMNIYPGISFQTFECQLTSDLTMQQSFAIPWSLGLNHYD